jgi:hypothetical protein
MQPQQQPPGWYHASDGPYERWWNGTEWTEYTRPLQTGRGTFAVTGTTIVMLIIIAVCYVGYHNYKYQNCIVQPGLFSWPTQCL